MLSLQLTVAAAGRILILASQAPVGPPAPTLPVIADSQYLRLFLDGETVTNTSDSRLFIDSSQNNFTITNSGRALYQGGFNPYGDVSAWSMDAANQRVQLVGSTSTFNFMHNTTAKFTFECWMYVDAFPSSSPGTYLLDNRENFNNNRGLTIVFETSGKITLEISTGTSVPLVFARSTSTVAISSWTHVAVTYDQSLASENAKIYIDGALTTSSNKSSTPLNADAAAWLTLLGDARINSDTRIFRGLISNLRISNDVLYSTTTRFTPPTAGLTATSATQLLTFQNNSFKDNSQNAYAFSFASPQFGSTDIIPTLVNPFGAPLWTTSSVGSVNFSGRSANQGIVVPADNAFMFGTGDFTIESWIWTAPFDSYERMIFGIVPSTAATSALAFSLRGSDLRPQVYSRATNSFVTATTAVSTRQWQHVAAVRENSTLTIYVNGIASVTATNYTVNFNSSTQYMVGKNNDSSRHFTGLLSDLRVVKGVAVYTATFVPPVEPLTAISGTSLLLKFNNGGIIDKSRGYYPVNFVNTSTTATGISTVVAKNGNSSLHFPGGISDYAIVDYATAVSSLRSRTLRYGNRDFTLEFWVNFQEFRSGALYTNDSYALSQGVSGNIMLIHANTTTNRINLYITGNGSTWNITSATAILSSAPTLDTWYHLAVTRNGNVFRTFANGTQVSTFSTSTSLYTLDKQLYIGGSRYNVAGTNFKGYMDDFKIYLGQARYTSDFTPT